MQVAITSRHGTLSPSAHEHIARKAEKLLTFFDRVTAINVTVDFSNDRIEVEILVDAEHRHDLVASESGDSVIPFSHAYSFIARRLSLGMPALYLPVSSPEASGLQMVVP